MISSSHNPRNSHSSSEDEVELIRRIRENDREAFEKLYELYKQPLFGIVLTIIKKRKEAEDKLRDLFVWIWQKAHNFDVERGNVYCWLVTLARDMAVDHIRSSKHEEGMSESDKNYELRSLRKGDLNDPFETTIYSNRAELVKKALSELPDDQREILKVAYFRGMTQNEIANYLDITPEKGKTLIKQGMMNVNRIMEDYISAYD